MEAKDKQPVSPGQMWAAAIGIGSVAVLDTIDVIDASGPGIEGAIRAGIYYGLFGTGGGLIVYEIIRRIRERI